MSYNSACIELLRSLLVTLYIHSLCASWRAELARGQRRWAVLRRHDQNTDEEMEVHPGRLTTTRDRMQETGCCNVLDVMNTQLVELVQHVRDEIGLWDP